MADGAALDLHAIATLANYERATSDPRFRHYRLREMSDIRGVFRTIGMNWQPGELDAGGAVPVRGFAFEKAHRPETEMDLPSNLCCASSSKEVARMSERELDTIYWEVHGHDGCYASIALIQHLFDLYDPTQALRIRTADGDDFTTVISNRVILEFFLQHPRQATAAVCLAPANTTYITGGCASMLHSVWGFGRPGHENVAAALDMASMQFGERGRGKGGETFVLGSLDGFYDMAERVAEGHKPRFEHLPGGAGRVGPSPHDIWLRPAAQRVRERWEARATKPWCGYCGAPGELRRCPCGEAWYCNAAHQAAGWRYHKRWCGARRNRIPG